MERSKFKNIIILFSFIFLTVFLTSKTSVMENLESLDIPSAIGYSIDNKSKNNITYIIPISSIIYNENGMNEAITIEGKGESIGKSRESRQRRDDKKFSLGAEKVYIIDEAAAKFGIRPMVDIVFKNANINDTGVCTVCKGNSKDYLDVKIEGYDSSAEYIEGMIKNSPSTNYFSEEFTIADIFLNLDAEGKNIVLPYIDKGKDGFNISGTAVFIGEKLATVLDINNSRLMNMLRNQKSKGMLTIQKSSMEYINYDVKVKRKVKCNKIGNNYKFTINLNIVGDIVSNTLYKDMKSDTKVIKKFEEEMAKKVEAETNDFIEKMKNQYKVDCLNLGYVAAAKYGRGTGVDWNKVVCASDIKVKVKVKVDKIGRGEYN